MCSRKQSARWVCLTALAVFAISTSTGFADETDADDSPLLQALRVPVTYRLPPVARDEQTVKLPAPTALPSPKSASPRETTTSETQIGHDGHPDTKAAVWKKKSADEGNEIVSLASFDGAARQKLSAKLKQVAASTSHLLQPKARASRLGKVKLFDQTGCYQRCPACNHVCQRQSEEVDEEKSCFDVETKVICIPRVVFPWQKESCSSCVACDSCDGSGCQTCKPHRFFPWLKSRWSRCDSCDGGGGSICLDNGARTREVRVLKSKKYKCSKCEHIWTAEPTPCCGCDCRGCDQVIHDDTPWVAEPIPSPEPVAKETQVELAPAESLESAPAEKVESAPAEKVKPAPVEKVKPAPAEKVELVPATDAEPLPAPKKH